MLIISVWLLLLHNQISHKTWHLKTPFYFCSWFPGVWEGIWEVLRFVLSWSLIRLQPSISWGWHHLRTLGWGPRMVHEESLAAGRSAGLNWATRPAYDSLHRTRVSTGQTCPKAKVLSDFTRGCKSFQTLCWGSSNFTLTPFYHYRVGHDWGGLACMHALEKAMATHSSILDWRIPGNREAWWAAVYGVAQSRTRRKRLSSSSTTY